MALHVALSASLKYLWQVAINKNNKQHVVIDTKLQQYKSNSNNIIHKEHFPNKIRYLHSKKGSLIIASKLICFVYIFFMNKILLWLVNNVL